MNCLLLCFTIVLCFYHTTVVSAVYSKHYSHRRTILASPSTFPYSHAYRRPRRSLSSSSQDYAIAALSARRKSVPETPTDDVFSAPAEPRKVTFDDLNPIGKVVAGTTQIVVTTVLEYITGFSVGLTFGVVASIPGLLFRPVEPGVQRVFMKEVSGRLGRMKSRSVGWATNWGGISAAFGGFKVAVQVVRGGREDNWNTILSSAAAGAFFARNEGPQAMLKGAVTYGAMIYLFSGGMGTQRTLNEYNEAPVEF